MSPYPFVGFVAGTPILTSTGYKSIEDIKPRDMIQVSPTTTSASLKSMRTNRLAGGM